MKTRVSEFYDLLRREVRDGNPGLTSAQQVQLQGHYELMMTSADNTVPLVKTIYASRRTPIAVRIAERGNPTVLDAGCGFGSECFFFAALGARVLAVDISESQLQIAEKRQSFFENELGVEMDIEWIQSDLDDFELRAELDFTWMASVLNMIEDQGRLIQRIASTTKPGGSIQVTDMNLLNPLFNMIQARERKRSKASPSLSVEKRFFWARSITELLETNGFEPQPVQYSAFIPPRLRALSSLEPILARIPLLRAFGYFYLIEAIRTET